ncbi:hypothetical protein D3C73_1495750 [compost metagenome]
MAHDQQIVIVMRILGSNGAALNVVSTDQAVGAVAVFAGPLKSRKLVGSAAAGNSITPFGPVACLWPGIFKGIYTSHTTQ